MSGESSRPWKKLKTLGSGSFGTVYLTNHFAAVKTANSRNYPSLERESRFLKELRGNPFVVECFGEDISQEERGEWYYNVIMERATVGNLDDVILGRRLPESDVAYYSYLLLRGLSEIHRKGIIHCDIKPNNILVFENCHGLEHLKLADFGLAKFDWENDESEKLRGALKYAAPESVSRGTYSKATDVWSFGMTVLKMMTGGEACWGKSIDRSDLKDVIVMKGAPKTPDYVSEKGKDFLRKCLNWEAEGRWSAEKLVNHPFIRDNMREKFEEWMISPPGFESRDLVAMKNPFSSSWSSTWGLFSSGVAPSRRHVCSDVYAGTLGHPVC